MNVIEIILIAIGMTIDIFGYVVCKSSSYGKVDKKKLGSFCLVFVIWEFISLVLGYYTVELMTDTHITDPGSEELHMMAIIIITVLAVRMLFMGLKRDMVIERRNDEINIWQLMKDTFFIALRTYLMGFAFAGFQTLFSLELLILMIVGLIMVISGLYIGYRYGFEIKNKAYIISAILLFGTDIDMFIRAVFFLD